MINVKELKKVLSAGERLELALFGFKDGKYFEEITKEEYEEKESGLVYNTEDKLPTIIEYHENIKRIEEEKLEFEIEGYEIYYFVGSECLARAYKQIKNLKKRIKNFEEQKMPEIVIRNDKERLAFYQNVFDDMVKKVGEE